MPDTGAAATGAEVSGAPAGSELDRFLKLQGLQVEDVEDNRAGRVSPRQATTVANRRTNVTSWLLLGVGAFVAVALAAAITEYIQKERFGMFIVAGVALAIGIMVYVAYTILWRPPTASQIAERKVVPIQGKAESIAYWPHKGFYDIKVQGTSYQGYTAIDSGLQGKIVKIYVVPDYKIVVAMEPVD